MSRRQRREYRFDEQALWRTFLSNRPMAEPVTLTIERRRERTRDAILSAFVRLIFREGFENISVQKIVVEAAIARSTFYEHFSSKEDVLRASMARFFTVFARCVSINEPRAKLMNVLHHFWENRRLTDAIFIGTPRQIIALSLSEMIEARLRELTREELLLPRRLAAIHIAEAQLALVESWLRGRAFARVEDVAEALYRSSRQSAAAMMRTGLRA